MVREQLCLESAAALLERVMLERLQRLKGNPEGDIEDLEFDDNASFDARSLSRRRQEFRCILKEYSCPSRKSYPRVAMMQP